MKKIVAAIVIFIIFVIALFLLSSRSAEAPAVTGSPNAANSPTVAQSAVTPASPENKIVKPDGSSRSGRIFEIIISQNGVSQNNLSLKIGDAVSFKNMDSALHWPASGLHPTHLGCPNFDSLRGLKQGETFSFTFEKALICSFHDHLNARNTSYNGTVTITE